MRKKPDFEPPQPSLFYEEAYDPVDMGWVLLKGSKRVWEKPNGELYVFAEGAPQLIYKPCEYGDGDA